MMRDRSNAAKPLPFYRMEYATRLLFVAAFIGAIGATAAAFDYQTDPPAGSISCGKRVTVKSSKACGGKSATIIGGCNIDSSGNQKSGARRRVVCGK